MVSLQIDYIKAQNEIERSLMRQELKQLRTKAYSEGAFAETFKKIEGEKEELQRMIGTLESKNKAVMDDAKVCVAMLHIII